MARRYASRIGSAKKNRSQRKERFGDVSRYSSRTDHGLIGSVTGDYFFVLVLVTLPDFCNWACCSATSFSKAAIRFCISSHSAWNFCRASSATLRSFSRLALSFSSPAIMSTRAVICSSVWMLTCSLTWLSFVICLVSSTNRAVSCFRSLSRDG